jgi:hypothetical protein
VKTARWRPAAALLAGAAIIGGCSTAPDQQLATQSPATEPADAEQRYPDVLAAALHPSAAAAFNLDVTISSTYDTPQRYADGWRVLTPDGVELGSHTLLHDHATEQPFTRTQRGLVIPDDVEWVIVEGRDLVHGYGGATVEVIVPGR